MGATGATGPGVAGCWIDFDDVCYSDDPFCFFDTDEIITFDEPVCLPTISGELIVADGITGPPVFLTNEAEDDYVYEDRYVYPWAIPAIDIADDA